MVAGCALYGSKFRRHRAGFDPFVYLGLLAGATQDIALATGSIILPLRHPAHVAKAAASADQLSGGRLILGVASGDRPDEYPALNMNYPDRGARFRESFDYIRAVAGDFPVHQNSHGTLPGGMDMLPKPVAGRIPMLITGGSQQDPDWIAAHSDGWITYPRGADAQGRLVADYRVRSEAAGAPVKPVSQSLYIDLVNDPGAAPSPIHLGFRSGVDYLKSYLSALEQLGINHVAINLRFNEADVEDTLMRLADELLPLFSHRRRDVMSKTILITGATDGIGLVAAKRLAGEGHTVLLHGRSRAKLEAAEQETGAKGYLADLSSLEETRTMAEPFWRIMNGWMC